MITNVVQILFSALCFSITDLTPSQAKNANDLVFRAKCIFNAN